MVLWTLSSHILEALVLLNAGTTRCCYRGNGGVCPNVYQMESHYVC